MKLCFLYINLILFIGCAAQGTASGGPEDFDGPKLISIQPENKSVNISPNQKIVLSFNELLDPVSIQNAITITDEYKIKVKGRYIIIMPNMNWSSNKMLTIYLSRKIRDYQKNIMAEPIQLAYSTGGHIPKTHIVGKIEGYEKGTIVEVGLYNWPLYDGDTILQKVETYDNGFFKFEFIEHGKYTLGAVESVLTDFGKQIRRKNYAMLSSNYIHVSPKNKIHNVKIKLSDPIKKLKITTVEMKSQFGTNLIFSDLSEENFIIDTMYVPGDSVNINMIKSNRLETYTLPEFTFILPKMIDMIGPEIENYELIDENLQIQFSEPVQVGANSILYEKNNQEIPYDFIMKNSHTVILSNIDDSITRIKLIGNIIKDLNGNIMNDSIKYISVNQSIQQDEKIIGGNILGTVEYSGNEPLVIEARNIETNEIYNTHVNKLKFELDNLKVGIYKLWTFESLHQNDDFTFFSGTWEPYHRAARFSIYPDTIDVRARWDVEGIIIDLD